MTDPRPAKPSAREAYYAQAATWAVDKEQSRHRSTRVAWLIAGIAIGIAMLEAVALMLLTPLKRVEPYTILVDRNTGHVQVMEGAGLKHITADEALTNSLLAQYVIAREGFDITSIRTDHRKVALWSGDPVRTNYLAMMEATNPASPLQRMPRTSIISVQIKSISPIAPDTAMVRFDATRLDQGQATGTAESFVSILRYRFNRAPMSLEDRLVNPLGFQVIHYRRDQERLPEATVRAVDRMLSTGTQPTVATSPAIAMASR